MDGEVCTTSCPSYCSNMLGDFKIFQSGITMNWIFFPGHQLPWLGRDWACSFPLCPQETKHNSGGIGAHRRLIKTMELSHFGLIDVEKPCFLFRPVWTKCVSWLMPSTPTWTLPFLLSPWPWWRNLTKMASGSGTPTSVTWRQCFTFLFLLQAEQDWLVWCASALLSFPVHQESGALVLEALRLSQDEDFCLGVKLVRGAYMDKERKLAEKEGHPDPIHASWEDTNERWKTRQRKVLCLFGLFSISLTHLHVCAVTTHLSRWCWKPFPTIPSAIGSL